MISITQANTEPWLSIWHEGQEKTWMQKYNSTVNIVNCKFIPSLNFSLLLFRFFVKLSNPSTSCVSLIGTPFTIQRDSV